MRCCAFINNQALRIDQIHRINVNKLAMQFEAIAKFSPEEKKILKEILEGLTLKHRVKMWSAGAWQIRWMPISRYTGRSRSLFIQAPHQITPFV